MESFGQSGLVWTESHMASGSCGGQMGSWVQKRPMWAGCGTGWRSGGAKVGV
jgi:hypothetical protein